MFASFLYPFKIRGCEAPFLMFFYKQMYEFSPEDVLFIGSKAYFTPPSEFRRKNRWETMEKACRFNGYECPPDEDLNSYRKYIFDTSVFDALIAENGGELNKAWTVLLQEPYPPMEREIERLVEQILEEGIKIDAFLMWCNCPSLKTVARKHNIPVIHNELGPFRAPDYKATVYLDFSGVNGHTECAARYERFKKEIKETGIEIPDFSYRELLDMISASPLVRTDKPPQFKVGAALQVEDDSNVLAYSNGNDNFKTIARAKQGHTDEELLVRRHPCSHLNYDNAGGVVDTSPNSFEFIQKCEEIFCINSSVGIESLLLEKKTNILGDNPAKFILDLPAEERKLALTFLLFGYLTPREFLLNKDYYLWRLQPRKEIDIFLRHMKIFWSQDSAMRVGSQLKNKPYEEKIKRLTEALHELLQDTKLMANSKRGKFVHFVSRIFGQLLTGSLKDKKDFLIWCKKRLFHEFIKPNPDYNPYMDLHCRISKKMAEILNLREEEKIRITGDRKWNSRDNYNKYDILFFSVIDYDFRYQRPQQIADFYAAKGHRVFFFNVNFDCGDAIHVVNKKQNLYLVTFNLSKPGSIFHNLPASRIKQMRQQIQQLLFSYGIADCVAICEYPQWMDILSWLKDSCGTRIILDYLDDYTGFERTVSEQMRRNTKNILKTADKIIASSDFLYRKAVEKNQNVSVIRNGTDFEHFSAAYRTETEPGKRKQIGYYGALSHWFDFRKVELLAERFPDVDIVLIGEVLEDTSALKKYPNVKFPGEKEYSELPCYLKDMDVCLIPFDASTDLIRATNPVKFYEYLSAGKKVVATEIPELEAFRDKYVYLANDNEKFCEYVKLCLEGRDTLASPEELRTFAKENDWSNRIRQFSEEVSSVFPKISVIVLTYNQIAYTKQCLQSILKWTAYPNFELIVVDNASTDETQDYLRELKKRHPQIKLILNEENLGFAAGNNRGLEAAEGKYIVLLNNDTIVTRGWLTHFRTHFERNPITGAVGAVTNSIGNEAVIPCEYTTLEQLSSFAMNLFFNRSGEELELDTLAMFCFAVSREAFEKVGKISECYGRGMFEDDDYCEALRRAGYRLVCAEDLFVHHFLSASFQKVIPAEKEKLMKQNQKTFEEKWNRKWEMHSYRPGVLWNTNAAVEAAYDALLKEEIQ